MKKYFFALTAGLFLLFAPSSALAVVEGEYLIPSWVNPVPTSVFTYGANVIVTGTWQLPPNWVGNIYVYQDAQLDGGGNMLTRGTQMSNTAGETKYAISNLGNSAESSGNFSFDIGPQVEGEHNMHLEFWGGEECAINKSLNSLPPYPNYQPECDITSDNAAFNIVWPVRKYSVGLPPFPRMIVNPVTNPAINFANVVYGTAEVQSFSVSNTGGQTFSGAIPALPAPFRCVSGCVYVINPGETKPVAIEFFPQNAPQNFSQAVVFTCTGTTLQCKKTVVTNGVPTETDEVSQSRNVQGNSVSNVVSPQISVIPTSVNYGTVNLGSAIADRTFRVSNTGGGFLNGEVTFSSVDYSCVGPCNYSVPAGGYRDIVVRFNPQVAGARDDTAVFTGGAGQTVRVQSNVNDKPIMEVWNPSVNFGSNINVGSCRQATVWIRNRGAGILRGEVSNIPIASYNPPGQPARFSCVANCIYDNLPNGLWHPITVRFCPVNASPDSAVAMFSNINNPPAGGQATLSGQGNVQPIGTLSRWTINWGGRLVGGSYPASVTLTNTGIGVLGGSIGALPAGFRCASGCTYSLSAGESTQILFYFEPTAVGAYSGLVTIPGATQNLSLTGSGVQPSFYVSYSGWPYLGRCPGATCVPASPKTFDVGNTTFGGALSIQNKQFSLFAMNLGSGANVNFSFGNAPHFVCIGGSTLGCSGSLVPYGGWYYYNAPRYEFRPDAPGDYEEPITISYDYGDGISRQETMILKGHSISAPYLSVIPQANINLGSVRVGNTAQATFRIGNIGNGPMNGSVSIPASPGSSPSAFRCISGCSWSGLEYNEFQNVVFEFAPTSAISYSAYPVFSSNGGTIGYPTWPWPSITGIGSVSPTIQVSPLSLVFPDTNLGQFSNRTVTITNTGLGMLTGNITPFAPSGLDFFCVGDCGYNLASGVSVDKTIQFRPLATGDLSGVLTLNSNADNGPQTLSVFGRAVFAPIIDIRGADTNYGNVVVGKYKDRTFTVRNSGTADLGEGTFEITGPYACIDPIDISDGKCHYNLTAGSQIDITVRFSPAVAGRADGVVSLSGVPLARFFVTGVGVPPSVKFIEQ